MQVLKPGTKITVVKREGSWTQIRTTERLLRVFNSYLMEQAPKAQPVAAQHQEKPQQQGRPQAQDPQDGQPPHKPVNCVFPRVSPAHRAGQSAWLPAHRRSLADPSLRQRGAA